ncbi:MAG TPA: alkaline phosphatase family protein [Marinilabiliales bacterium]|nr:MAG: hypothetical protein A2W84_10720 [Bacteroidetes bacterium GWC2_40_13]OFX72120.1 MAG: hypothetical protein A2W96_00055 [Bacteroidetes bacterium GWD2_40_43]OFX92506.1 MAG: hypothetical protein A2W97_10830 [Bacteroidetes bacterium GWE2_40_63]OFY16444.1 MAG: hypothetical protein A2W88_18190 [Bacteroidetes bacterium GWF2_40_13]OFZ27185.1 MAG: hypothetical protein A2437_18755 [Bacteroidetes bacterium RIFOXYC2_FULL_40_12]HAM97873.1 alkaline phosphatase family protein [Marinilabiliales bacteri
MKKTIIILLLVFIAAVGVQDFLNSRKARKISDSRNYTVVLSLDGFRWDYQSKVQTPWFDSITKMGVKAEGLQPSFPSKTFPNHYTIATGLYPGNHGLISNSFYAPDVDDYYAIGDRSKVENGEFYLGEPIWVTAEAQNVISANYFWVGSEAKIKGYQPTYWKKYDHNFPYLQRADSVIHWLNLPYEKRPHLVMWYLDKTDGIGHDFGPDSPQIQQTVAMLDSLIGYFMQQMSRLAIKDSINFIIVSDHGMGKIDTTRVVYLNDYLKNPWIDTAIGNNPFILMHPQKNCKDSILTALANVAGVKAWDKAVLPERFHYKQSKRVSEVVIVADSAWSVTYSHKKKKHYDAGTHGYDNLNKDMYGIFYATGPDFKSGYDAGLLYNVDIYNLLASLLEIKPAPNDGQPERIMHVLKKTDPSLK